MTPDAFARWSREPISGTPDLSIVIPAFNETRRIFPTIASIAAHLAERSVTWELIVADDGSTDGMPSRLAALHLANLRLVGSGCNEGKGAAVRRGLLAARGEAVLFSDADMSTPIDELDGMLERLRDGADLVIGSRAAVGATVDGKSRARKLFSTSLRLLVGALLPTGVRDTQCGFKLFRRDVAHELANAQLIDGFSFDLELLYIARRWRLRVDEMPVAWVDAPGSTVDPAKEALRFLRDILAIRCRALAGTYRRRSARRGDAPGAKPDTGRTGAPGAQPAAGRADAPSALAGAARWSGADAPLHVAVVTSYPPSRNTLNEYGAHLVGALAGLPEIATLTVLHDRIDGEQPTVPDGARAVEAWRFGSWANPIRIVRTVRRERPDAVLFNLQFASFGAGRVAAALGVLTPLLVRLAGTPTVVLLHNLVDTVDLEQAGFARNRALIALYRSIGRLLTRLVLRADRVLVTIPAYHDLLAQRYGARNVAVTPHGTFGRPTQDIAIPTGRRRILTFGKFGTYKRVDDLIGAYRLLLAAGYDDLELVIAGTDAANTPGYLEAVRSEHADVPGLVFTGYVAEDDVEATFRSATLVAFPYTSTTGSSGPLHQAGMFGRAVVLPAIGDFLEVIHDEGFTGETFEPGDEMSLAGAIARLLDDPDRRDDIARRNAAAASALPLDDIAAWHLLHLESLTR